jgi:mannose-6-phosphate isomerase-like protein (cupin superfamily)
MVRGVVINAVEGSPPQGFPAIAGARAEGEVVSRHVIAGAHSLTLWVHEMQPRSVLNWQSPDVDHMLYVWKGSAAANGIDAGPDQPLVVERGSAGTIEAGPSGATVAHFYESAVVGSHSERRAGGHIHVCPKGGQFAKKDEERAATHMVWADAHCPTCQLWLHKSSFRKVRAQSEPHLHNEDEIIFVVEGEVLVGRAHKPGTAIAVAEGTTYAFGIGQPDSAFINFRATNPLVKMVRGGKPVGEWVSERSFMRNEARVPVIDPRAALAD